MDEVWDTYATYDDDAQEITWFLDELIHKLKDERVYYENLIEDDNE